ncbi:MAG: threonine synthase [Hyphomicrobiales bacterium]|nr:MAG: threonine synthase [Hyphomicrobiales bacterium]
MTLFISTRGNNDKLNFEDVMLRGLAPDGGLYVPETWPTLSQDEWRSLVGKPYTEVALAVISPFVGDCIPRAELKDMIEAAYASFSHKAVTPLTQLDVNQWLLELYHGPTIAFKDVAMQLIAKLMDRALTKRGLRSTIVCATSGDTGGAAVEAFMTCDRIDLFVLHPDERVSQVQRKQMTTSGSANVFNIAIKGNFDDCQNQVKAMFNNENFRDQVALSGVNSINWARIMAQVVYYVTASLSLGGPDKTCDFTVPTGNFGDIFAAYVAKKMGLPMGKLIVATNENDILQRALKTGKYDMHKVIATTSPSMDIQISSNFERLLFEASGRDSHQVNHMMASLKQSDQFEIPAKTLANINQSFAAGRADENAVSSIMKTALSDSAKLIDPHTAVALSVAQNHLSDNPMVILSTAHPAKFPDAVKAATGIHPPLPAHLSDLFERTEKYDILDNEADKIMQYIKTNSRVVN